MTKQNKVTTVCFKLLQCSYGSMSVGMTWQGRRREEEWRGKERQNTWNRTWLLSQYSTHPTWHVEVEQKQLQTKNLQGVGGI